MYWIRQLFGNGKAHFTAASEVFVITLFSLIPLFIAALSFNMKRTDHSGFVLGEVIDKSIGSGQLYLYSFSLIGTLVWLSFVRWDVPSIAPRKVLGLLVFIGGLFITSLAGIDPTLSQIKNQFIVSASYITYGLSIFIYYLLVFYCSIRPPDPADSISRGTSELIQKFEAETE